jgi:hypothetical protein
MQPFVVTAFMRSLKQSHGMAPMNQGTTNTRRPSAQAALGGSPVKVRFCCSNRLLSIGLGRFSPVR